MVNNGNTDRRYVNQTILNSDDIFVFCSESHVRKERTETMEILICTGSKNLWKKLSSLADRFLCSRKSRYMSVSFNLFVTEKAIAAAVEKHKAAIVIIDVQSFDNWQEIVQRIEGLSRAARICLVSGSPDEAVNAVNGMKSVCGYILGSRLESMFAEVFSGIYGRLRTVCGGIAVTHYSSVEKIIPFDEVFFIETVKQTHMCRILHKNGTDEIRADISKLIGELPEIFQIVRSSAIANLSNAKAFSDGDLIFADGSVCQCVKKYSSEISGILKQTVLQ